MNNITKVYIGVLVVVLVLLTLLELNKTPIINWSLNYELEEKSPFGLYVFNEEAESFFDNKLEKTSESPYNYLPDSATTPKNYLIIENNFTEQGFDKLLTQIDKGSNLFLATSFISDFIIDTLNLKANYSYSINDTMEIYFTDEKIKEPIILDKTTTTNFVTKIDTVTTRILAYSENEDHEKEAILTQIKYGKGKVFILNQPILFTNYYLLKEGNDKIIPHVFDYMPKQETVWFQDEEMIGVSYSPMRFILQNKSLKYAWYTILVSIILFAFFTAKRKQRIIPIKEPVTNKSVEFVRNIGNLYLQEGNDKDMAHKKATYFLQKVRTELYIPTDELDDAFARKLQLKTNQSKENIEEAMRLIKKAIHPKAPIQREEFIKLNKLLDEIYK
ncbi:hypothetical protein KRX57_07320 [Weeksellaceae bacterium TAE3-ERU29]|nr:hypothetical protein [Weeksellaceae bacterium TAE3-ERU29]